MKKTTLLKTMLLLCALVVGSGSLWATDVTFTAGTDKGSNGSSGNPDTMTKSGITISGTSFATTTDEYRIYSGSTLTISSSVGNITKIIITSTAKKGSKYGPDLLSVSGYSTETDSKDGTWTGSATSVVFTASAQCRASTIVVTYSAPTKVATPTFSPAEGAVASGTDVTISCATDDTKIYYTMTTDGSTPDDPTSADTQYTAAINITTATKIKAIAIDDNGTLANSDIASANYTIAEPCATPTFSVAEGEVDKGTSVTISCATDGATIYYTTNGTTPTTSSSVYSSALTLNTSQTIKAIAAKDGYANSAVASASYTVRDYATLPFTWAGGTSDGLTALSGVTASGVSSYGSNAPYQTKFDNDDQYVQIKTNAQLGQLSLGVKMIGGATTSYFYIKESSDGSSFTDVETLTISGKQNDVLTLITSKQFKAATRYVRFVFDKGSNVGVGPIKLTGCEAVSTAAGKTYATYVTTNALDFSVVSDDIKAYVAASTASEGSITFTGKDAVPAGTPLLIKTTSAGATVNVPVAASAPAAIATNYLVAGTGSNVTYDASASHFYYILTNGEFKQANDSPVAVGKAYLALPSAATSNELTINFDDEAGDVTGIATVSSKKQNNGEYYNLNGQRVDASHKGIVIVNGKKFFNK